MNKKGVYKEKTGVPKTLRLSALAPKGYTAAGAWVAREQ